MEMLSEKEFWFGAIIFIFLIILVILKITKKKDRWVSTESFEREKKKLHPHFSEKEYKNFMNFLDSYKGGFVRRKSGRIVYQDYLNKEKGGFLLKKAWNPPFRIPAGCIHRDRPPGIQLHNGCSGLPESGF